MITTGQHATEQLVSIGLTAHEREWMDTWSPEVPPGPGEPGPTLARVVEVQRDHVRVHDGVGGGRARVPHAVQLDLADGADALAVGDWVLVEGDRFGDRWVRARVPPRNQLARRLHDGRDKVERVVIVSNVDVALLVMGLDLDFNLRRLARYLALVAMAGVTPVVVLSKADLVPGALRERRLEEVRAAVPPGTGVHAVSGLDPAACAPLQAWLRPGRTLVLLGSSGAGKSTLTNTLCGTAQDTGPTRAGDGHGRHTTTVRSLHRAPGGACIVDTPGLRTLRLDGDEAALRAVYADVEQLGEACRFRDCQHADEPGCVVRATLDPQRLRSWHKLQREAQRDTMGALERQRQQAEWKRRTRAGRARAKDKRA